jgi:hypothetical protein
MVHLPFGAQQPVPLTASVFSMSRLYLLMLRLGLIMTASLYATFWVDARPLFSSMDMSSAILDILLESRGPSLLTPGPKVGLPLASWFACTSTLFAAEFYRETSCVADSS